MLANKNSVFTYQTAFSKTKTPMTKMNSSFSRFSFFFFVLPTHFKGKKVKTNSLRYSIEIILSTFIFVTLADVGQVFKYRVGQNFLDGFKNQSGILLLWTLLVDSYVFCSLFLRTGNTTCVGKMDLVFGPPMNFWPTLYFPQLPLCSNE